MTGWSSGHGRFHREEWSDDATPKQEIEPAHLVELDLAIGLFADRTSGVETECRGGYARTFVSDQGRELWLYLIDSETDQFVVRVAVRPGTSYYEKRELPGAYRHPEPANQDRFKDFTERDLDENAAAAFIKALSVRD